MDGNHNHPWEYVIKTMPNGRLDQSGLDGLEQFLYANSKECKLRFIPTDGVQNLPLLAAQDGFDSSRTIHTIR